MIMKALVTGATGFIGSHLVETLLERNTEVRCLVRQKSNRRWLPDREVEFLVGDCRDPASLDAAVSGVDLVFHLAGVVRARGYEEYFLSNSTGTRNLLRACLRSNPGLNRFVLVSSQAAAGPSADGHPLKESDAAHPISAYGWSKLMAEKEALELKNDLPVVVMRPSPVYGPRDRDFHTIFKMIKLGLRPVIGREERYIHMTYVRDVVEGAWLAARNKRTGAGPYFIADERSYSWGEIGRILGMVLNKKTRQLTIPKSLSWLVARMAELWATLLRRPATINREKRREMLARYWLCDTTLAREELGFRADHPLPVGAEHTIRWYRDNGWL
jgi:nucleoside-diphosphate-sugar epimerase